MNPVESGEVPKKRRLVVESTLELVTVKEGDLEQSSLRHEERLEIDSASYVAENDTSLTCEQSLADTSSLLAVGDGDDNEDNEAGLKRRYDDCVNISSLFQRSFGSKAFTSKKVSPNYFFCVRVSNENILKAVDGCQKEILKNDPGLAKAILKVETMHVTLFALYIDQSRISLNEVNNHLIKKKDEVFSSLRTSGLVLKFRGLSTFRNQVVYVDLLKDEHYEALKHVQRKLVEIYDDKIGVDLCETSFTPHMTLMKLSKSKHFHKKGVKKIDKRIYEAMIGVEFGNESISEVLLCNIREKTSDGFYRIEGSFKFE